MGKTNGNKQISNHVQSMHENLKCRDEKDIQSNDKTQIFNYQDTVDLENCISFFTF